MTTRIDNYNGIKKTVIEAKTHRTSDGGYLSEIAINLGGELKVSLMDDIENIELFASTHNIPFTKDDRTGVEKYLDRMELAL